MLPTLVEQEKQQQQQTKQEKPVVQNQDKPQRKVINSLTN